MPTVSQHGGGTLEHKLYNALAQGVVMVDEIVTSGKTAFQLGPVGVDWVRN